MSWTIKLVSLSSLLFLKSLNIVELLNSLKEKSCFPGWAGRKETHGSVRSHGLVGGKLSSTLILICSAPWASYFTSLDVCFSYLWNDASETGGLRSFGTLSDYLPKLLWNDAVTSFSLLVTAFHRCACSWKLCESRRLTLKWDMIMGHPREWLSRLWRRFR